ncbi:hypothetical protein AGMMS49579_24220 [Spirochaetia bacterium]|nr:hypothetical protein AGMMS49579_24220 [Spirochaetia bacterium]
MSEKRIGVADFVKMSETEARAAIHCGSVQEMQTHLKNALTYCNEALTEIMLEKEKEDAENG